MDSGVDSAGQGAEAIADGVGQLQKEGTSQVLKSVVKASKDPAFARAYLAASQRRAADALPYGAPEGAAGRVSYIYTMPGSGETSTGSSLAGWALLAVIALAAGAVAWRRLHPVTAAAAPTDVPDEAPEEPIEPEPADPARDDDWFFRPESDEQQ